MRGGELLNGTKTAAAKFARDRLCARRVGVNYSNQPYWRTLLGKLMVNASMVAAEGAYANYRDVNKVIGCQESVPSWMKTR